MRVQFEIDEELWSRAKRYIKREKDRGVFARIAFEEWVNRREGRDKKLQTEQLENHKKLLKDVVVSLIEDLKE